MVDYEKQTVEQSPANNDLESQISSVPTKFPELDEYWENEDTEVFEEAAGERINGGDMMSLEKRWQIEQRLGAINTARESGTISPEVANALELDALRKFREIHFAAPGSELKIPLSAAHKVAEAHGMPVNTPRPQNKYPADYRLEF